MNTALRRSASVVLAASLCLALAGIASANVSGKSINTTTGECQQGASGCGAAVYGAHGFSGQLFGSGSASLVDFICVHAPGSGSFVTHGGTYVLTISDGATVLATTTETVTGEVDCSGQPSAAATAGSSTFTFPAGGSVQYTLLIQGVTSANAQSTFASYNSILNYAHDASDSSQQRSQSVPPPGPPAEIPEAPYAVLLLLSGIAAAVVFLALRRRRLSQGTPN